MSKSECPFEIASAEFEVELYELGVARDPDDLGLLEALAYAYTAVGRYADGLKADIKLVEAFPQSPHCLYNLACSFSLIGDGASSVDSLLKAVACGYESYDEAMRDPDLANARQYPTFALFVKAMQASAANGDQA